ncbi:XdhC family protein [Galbibacter sp. EGI 63066]|uniref:XdhC family protein n=1 Tax=Galbibacter sp. EGI 63066 TaxID=2993559 RepID=UPI0022499B71|nr:XdhC/CoxI family protein [Galbibacter sp. EGI 63066]MCX2679942.1 XdhC family protein [Galbibacter sp. EGI 63066]
MTHEFKKILETHLKAKAKGTKTVLATVVALDGSSYRRPGVRMLIREDGKMTGAVSGGCVEKEVFRQSQSVFETDMPKLMTYDGRYRLGCEGVLYILIEPFLIDPEFYQAFVEAEENRTPFTITSYFGEKEESSADFGSFITFSEAKSFGFSENEVDTTNKKGLNTFSQELEPSLKLIIIGAEHDAVQLCLMASLCGWEITIVASESDPKTLMNFPGAKNIENLRPEIFDASIIDDKTAVMLMTHSYTKDLQYLLKLSGQQIKYLGILGPSRRREKLFQELLERLPELDDRFLDNIYGPAGINIGAETPQEIALSIIAEILSVFREQTTIPLKEKKGTIHSGVKL